MLRYVIPALPLLSNSCHVLAALVDVATGHAYSHVERYATFRVVDDRGRYGLVDLGGRWEVVSTSQAKS